MKLQPLLALTVSTSLLAACSPATPIDPNLPAFSKLQIDSLRKALAAAPLDALPQFDSSALDRALDDGDENTIRRTALELTTNLAKAHLHGCAASEEREEWFVTDDADSAELHGKIKGALLQDEKLDNFFADLKPAHPDYTALRSAYQAEQDPARRLTLARNLERWRWMPRALGQDYVLANVPAFEVYLWRQGAQAQSWRAVVGKTTTPTPQLGATITAVTFNPWWDLPRSIIKEGGNFSERRGYVRAKNGHIRQKPGPRNALGQMKVEMANPHAIYLHDTPSKGLFGAERRAFSHGCLRIGDALGLATTLLEGVRTRDDIDILLGIKKPKDEERRISKAPLAPKPGEPPLIKTSTVRLPAALPVYIAYFTAAPRPDGTLAFPQDIYGRDKLISDPARPDKACAFGPLPPRPIKSDTPKKVRGNDPGP
jgi:L,D-transpeptidase YcbB